MTSQRQAAQLVRYKMLLFSLSENQRAGKMSKKLMYVMCVYAGHSENKRLRKPTKRLLESTEEYEQIFALKKKSKRNSSESSKMVRCSSFGPVQSKWKCTEIAD